MPVEAEATAARPARAGARAAQSPVMVNGRFRVHKLTGMQRYANELVSRFEDRVEVIEPKAKLKGPRGHAWEQFALPWRTGWNLLWSPCNSGPRWYTRQVVTIHDMFPLDYPEWFHSGFVRGFRAVVPPLIRRARHIIAVSHYTKQRIVETTGIPEDRITVVHSGVGEQFRVQPAEAAAAARRAIGLPDGSYFLSVSSLEPRKNVRRILDAWERALPHLPPDTWLVLAGGAGSGTVFAGLDLRRPPERVLFPGYLDDKFLPGLYAGATGFVFPSLAEGFGFPPLEAMACGAPVLCANTSSLLEVAASAAVLVNPLDVAQIARGIVDIALDANLRYVYRLRGLAQAEKFSWDTAARQTWEVLEHEREKLRIGRGRS
ncbi:MAG TPA: glycosyltransferase family 1 protein [Bryobacteraceae bacterium]|jgi:glycosyltransferase involved in cell wall biosynthesis|nr:glycosyltransferase family 1 protein [Bryobacteraceae bacterium]